MASYEEAFAKIQEATGIADTEELVTAFINVEDQNFSLFNFVNEMNQEIEKLEEQVGWDPSEGKAQALRPPFFSPPLSLFFVVDASCNCVDTFLFWCATG